MLDRVVASLGFTLAHCHDLRILPRHIHNTLSFGLIIHVDFGFHIVDLRLKLREISRFIRRSLLLLHRLKDAAIALIVHIDLLEATMRTILI